MTHIFDICPRTAASAADHWVWVGASAGTGPAAVADSTVSLETGRVGDTGSSADIA